MRRRAKEAWGKGWRLRHRGEGICASGTGEREFAPPALGGEEFAPPAHRTGRKRKHADRQSVRPVSVLGATQPWVAEAAYAI